MGFRQYSNLLLIAQERQSWREQSFCISTMRELWVEQEEQEEKLPSQEQDRHDEDAGYEYSPAVQGEHTEALDDEYVPAGHIIQVSEPYSE